MKDSITVKEANEGLLDEWRPHFRIQPDQIDRSCAGVFEAIWEAIGLAARRLTLDRSVVLVVGRPPFSLALKSGHFSFRPYPDVVHTFVEGIIFLDAGKLMGLRKEFQMVSVLEELVRVFMRVNDRDLATRVVAAIYPRVEAKGGLYYLRHQSGWTANFVPVLGDRP